MPNAGAEADGGPTQQENLVNDANGLSPKNTTNTGGAIHTGNGTNHMNGYHMNGFSAEKVISYRNGMS